MSEKVIVLAERPEFQMQEIERMLAELEPMFVEAKNSGEFESADLGEKWQEWDEQYVVLKRFYETKNGQNLGEVVKQLKLLLTEIKNYYNVELADSGLTDAKELLNTGDRVENQKKREQHVAVFLSFVEAAGALDGSEIFNALVKMRAAFSDAELMKLKKNIARKEVPSEVVKAAVEEFLCRFPSIDLPKLIDYIVPRPSKELLQKIRAEFLPETSKTA